MNKKFTKLMAALALLAFLAPATLGWGQTRTEVTDVMNQTWTGITGTSYTEKTELAGSASDAVYTVQCAGGNNSIQLRSSNNNSGIVSTTSGGTVTKVTVTWNSNTANGRTLNVYGKGSAYSAASDLYDANAAGTLIGTIVCGTSTELTISDSYEYIGMRSASNAMYLDEIKVTWATSGGGGGPTTYTVTYDCNGGTSGCPDNVSGIEPNTQIQLADAPSKDDYIFDGWSDGTTTYGENEDYTVTGNVTFTAQWSLDPSIPQYEWVKTDLADLTSSDIFVIVSTKSPSNYAMSNDNGASAAPTAVSVTIENNMITSYVASNIQWTGITGNSTDGYTIYSNADNTKYLYCINNNNGVRVGTGSDNTFIIKDNYIYNKGQGRYLGVYNNGDWRSYTSINNNISGQSFAFYKRQVPTTDPVINATNPDALAYDATEGEFNYSISNPTGATLSAVSNSEWITNVAVDGTNSKVTFNTSANTGDQRQGTITLSYTGATDKVVTITQAAAPVVYTTIPELFAAATSTATEVNVTFNDWIVSGVSTNGKNVFVTDNNGNGFVINSSSDQSSTYAVGNILSGTIECSLKLQNGYAQLSDVDANDLTIATGGSVDVANIALADLAGVNTGALVSYNSLICSVDNNKYYLTDGTTTVQVYTSLYGDLENSLENGKTYNITGIYQQYNTNNGNTKEILPRSADDIEEDLSASIVVANATVQVEGTGGSGLLTVTYTGVDGYYAVVQWCDQNGDPATSPNWLNAGLDEDYNLTYNVGPNNGEERSAYLKIFVEDVYSNLVTITQAAYVPDYAYLPFQFTGGYADIDDINGLTQENIDPSDYTSGNPKLKFNNKNDISSLVLKLNATPKAITFDIKGNSFSNGVFDVETSVDGENYVNLASYTELGNTQTITLFNTNDDVRFVRWIYTTKVNGNVGLGNIYVDDEYLVRGKATVAEDLTLDECTIQASGTLTIASGTLTVTDELTNEATENAWNNLVIKDGAQLKTPSAVNGTVEKFVAGYGTSTKGKYILLATPATMDACNSTGMWSTSNTGQHADVDFYSFDQNMAHEEWQNFKHGETTFAGPFCMLQGQGFLYANKEDVTLTLQTRGYSAPNVAYQAYSFAPTNANISAEVSYYADKPFSGWNLVGNPFTCKAYLTDGRDFYRMNDDGDAIIPATEKAIDVCEGIFVVTTSSESSVTFTTTDPSDSSVAPSVVNITMSQAQTRGEAKVIDAARIRFGEGQMLPKFHFMGNNSGLYIPQGSKDYSVVYSQGQGEMPVNFKAAENGTYTLNFNMENVEFNSLRLIDNMTGVETDLLQTPSYTFEAHTTDYASRFRLVFDANSVNENAENANFAFFNGSEWVINASENATVEVIDMMGRVVVCTDVVRNVSTNGLTAGVYMLRLVDGNSVKTQKVVVR